jgi:hypothetical protein
MKKEERKKTEEGKEDEERGSLDFRV